MNTQLLVSDKPFVFTSVDDDVNKIIRSLIKGGASHKTKKRMFCVNKRRPTNSLKEALHIVNMFPLYYTVFVQ